MMVYCHLRSFTWTLSPVLMNHYSLPISENVLQLAQACLIFFCLPFQSGVPGVEVIWYYDSCNQGLGSALSNKWSSQCNSSQTQIHGFANGHSHFTMTIHRAVQSWWHSYHQVPTIYIKEDKDCTSISYTGRAYTVCHNWITLLLLYAVFLKTLK